MKIKQLYLIITFVLFNSIVLYCQEADSLDLRICSTLETSLKDSVIRSQRLSDIDMLDSAHFGFERMNPMEVNISTKKSFLNAPYSKFIIPSAFILYGVAARNSGVLRLLDKNVHGQVDKRLKVRVPVDDYIQYVPAVSLYGLGLSGMKASHNLRDQTIVMATSYMIMATVVQSSKRIISVRRPDGSNDKSFPSGHTATAFVGAHLLFKEYKDTSCWIGIFGYFVAASTGGLRVLNKKHWVSDVIAGAGVGILSVELAYLMLPAFHGMLGLKDTTSKLAVAPVIANNNYGIGMSYTF